jgi:hypothetical protein
MHMTIAVQLEEGHDRTTAVQPSMAALIARLQTHGQRTDLLGTEARIGWPLKSARHFLAGLVVNLYVVA